MGIKPAIHFKSLLIVLQLLFIKTLTGQDSYFYTGKSYGSEANFNPINVLLNNGFDILQFTNRSRILKEVYFNQGFDNIYSSLTNPGRTISDYGIEKFLTTEVFPLSFKRTGMQWWPNYNIHLIGNGMTYRMLREWYSTHNYPAPNFLGITTSMIFHMFNEVVENNNDTGINADVVADIMIFDIAGIALFHSSKVCEFFSKKLQLSDWSLQPSFGINPLSIHNQGQYYSMKLKIPNSEKWSVFYTTGLDGLLGLSYKFSPDKSVSFGGGMIAREIVIVDENKNIKTVKTAVSLGIFYDRNNSLLASFRFFEKYDYRVLINVYPGIFKIGKISPGIWTALTENNSVLFGINTRWTPGVVLD